MKKKSTEKESYLHRDPTEGTYVGMLFDSDELSSSFPAPMIFLSCERVQGLSLKAITALCCTGEIRTIYSYYIKLRDLSSKKP